MRINPIILLFLVSICLNGLFGHLSYKFYQEKGAVQAALISCQESNDSLEKSIEKQQKEKDSIDVSVASNQQKQQEIHEQQCSIVEKIITINPTRKSNEEVDIDSRLPDSLSGLLKQSYNSLQESSGNNATKSSD